MGTVLPTIFQNSEGLRCCNFVLSNLVGFQTIILISGAYTLSILGRSVVGTYYTY